MNNQYDTQLSPDILPKVAEYKTQFQPSCPLNQVFSADRQGQVLELCGRVVGKRCFGTVAFADLYDAGMDIQLVFHKDTYPAAWSFFKKRISVGDYIGLCGTTGQTQNGTDSVFVHEVSLLTKSVCPLPDKHHGVRSSQTKRQSRYLDVLTSRDSYQIFLRRSQIQQQIRGVFLKNGYLEMDTPVLSSIPCASNARQFEAHHNDLDCSVYLRVSSELALKQLVLCGYNRVFEFCRNFRNEGTDRYHRQEFLNLEAYCAYATIDEMKALVRDLLLACCDGDGVLCYAGKKLSLVEIPTYNVYQLILERSGIDILEVTQLRDLKEAMVQRGMIAADRIDELGNKNACINRLVDDLVPADGLYYLEGYPAEIYPLCRSCTDDSRLADMQYLYINGLCLAQICGEETNPYRLRNTLEHQAKESAKQVAADESFLTAASYGMPPMCGIGLSMERLIMILCDCPTIYDSNFFHLNRR